MPIYKVTTEGDCEGRSVKELGYVRADNAGHAVKYLKSIGKNEYYQYCVEEVKDDLVLVAAPEHTLKEYAAIAGSDYGSSSYWQVKENKQILKEKQEALQRMMDTSGLTKEEVKKLLGF